MSEPRLRAALLGTGAWARVLARAGADARRFEFAGVWGRSPPKLAAFAEANRMAAVASLDAVWGDEAIDAVVIALPTEQHWPYAELAARHRKHVFIEKPIAGTLADGLAVAALEARHGVRIAVGHCARLLAGNRALRAAVRRGELGTVTLIEANFSNPRGLKLVESDWRWHAASAPGGPLSQIAIHQFDTLRALGGDIVSISARSARLSPAGAEVPDQWAVSLSFASGALGQVASSWTGAGTHSVRVTGTAATMFHEIDQTLWATPERLQVGAVLYRQPIDAGPGGRIALPVLPGNMFRDELDLFAASVLDGTECELSAANGCQALAAVEAALRSAERDGASVAIDDVIAAARTSA